MNIKMSDFYVSPISKERLFVEKVVVENNEVIDGRFCSKSGEKYKISNGIPDFTITSDSKKNKYAVDLFKAKAKDYDKYQHLSFETFYENETEVRNSMINKLNIKPASKILEVNAGTGRDSVLIAKRLSNKGLLHVQDISREMLLVCKKKLQKVRVPTEIHQSDACKLPFENNLFDAVYSFGGVGMNTYANNKEAIAELVRVTKVGGKIVLGGLSLAPWLRSTFFGKVLANYNDHYLNEIKLHDFPHEARNLNLSWIMLGAGFVIDFSVGDGEPKGNFEFEIPGPRGGTHKTRYEGNLEGVSKETKELAIKAREKLGISMHQWLDKIVKTEAEKILKKK